MPRKSYPPIPRPPAAEAIIELKFKSSSEDEVQKLKVIVDELRNQYPAHAQRHEVRGIISEAPEGERPQVTHESEVTGYELRSADGKQIVRVEKESLFFARLRPYTDGNQILSEYKGIWEAYSKHLKSKQITRFGMRYINKFNLYVDELEESLNFTANLGTDPDEPFLFNNLSAHFEFSDSALENHAKVNAYLRNAKINQETKRIDIEVILDIDVYNNDEIPFSDWTVIHGKLDNLRYFKNVIFFSTLTKIGLEKLRYE